jgi:hypothetical protein
VPGPRALAVGDVRVAGWLELEAQLVAACGHGVARSQVVDGSADVVVGVVQRVVLDVEAPPALVPWLSSTPSAPSGGISTSAVMLCGRLRTRGLTVAGSAWVLGRRM